MIGSLLHQYPNRRVISIDEKTGIQAIERNIGQAPKVNAATDAMTMNIFGMPGPLC